ncbi:hypothetical protein [Simiduia aestuariiviva]|uniref:Endogenous inhibitor of DNA gyrase (YacG/DUF329 family) n=1 Tax=Simiduia aestuariiviva TaxID=1510459 RepID=A0A839UMF7_9GAMM|nr:hypothetical protein [Simiduia aestuariiviva]MBB3168893.1 endogenous inhibitor of DNA gyrase (YacG/DUF329 family) [Simiduia aestuariiviva]
MSLILSRLKCPWCQTPVTKAQLKEQNLLQVYLKRQAFPCPHCQQQITLPERAEKLISSGLFVSVFLAPIFAYSGWLGINPALLFSLGVSMVLTGIYFQKLQKVDAAEEPQHEQK